MLNLILGISYNMPKIVALKFQSHSIKIKDFKINTYNLFNPISTKGGVKMLNLLLQMSYNMSKMVSSEFQSCIIKIEDFKINPINPFNPISTKGGGGENVKPITRNVL